MEGLLLAAVSLEPGWYRSNPEELLDAPQAGAASSVPLFPADVVLPNGGVGLARRHVEPAGIPGSGGWQHYRVRPVVDDALRGCGDSPAVSYTHLRAHET